MKSLREIEIATDLLYFFSIAEASTTFRVIYMFVPPMILLSARVGPVSEESVMEDLCRCPENQFRG